jgi:hypothetical protein
MGTEPKTYTHVIAARAAWASRCPSGPGPVLRLRLVKLFFFPVAISP